MRRQTKHSLGHLVFVRPARRTLFRLKQAEDRAHILEGYKIALDNLDDFVRVI